MFFILLKYIQLESSGHKTQNIYFILLHNKSSSAPITETDRSLLIKHCITHCSKYHHWHIASCNMYMHSWQVWSMQPCSCSALMFALDNHNHSVCPLWWTIRVNHFHRHCSGAIEVCNGSMQWKYAMEVCNKSSHVCMHKKVYNMSCTWCTLKSCMWLWICEYILDVMFTNLKAFVFFRLLVGSVLTPDRSHISLIWQYFLILVSGDIVTFFVVHGGILQRILQWEGLRRRGVLRDLRFIQRFVRVWI